MAPKNDSEEKNLPPSDRKLQKAREKGQVAKSKDLTTAAVMLSCTIYVVVVAPDIITQIERLMDQVAHLYDQPFDTLWPRIVAGGVGIGLHALLPLVLISALAVVIVNIVVMKGLVFSADPVTPKPERINPAEGFKRLFAVRQVIEFLKSLTKMVALLVALVVVYQTHLPALMQSSLCGMTCIRDTFFGLMKPLVITALLAFIIVGALDVFMQRWLFQRDQRMSKTEQKRERKDQQGDPTFKRERRKRSREVLSSGKTGVHNATFAIGEPGGWVVGIRFVAEEAGVPFLAFRNGPDTSATVLKESSAHGLPVARDGKLAQTIAEKSKPGGPLPQATFQEVANIMVAIGLL